MKKLFRFVLIIILVIVVVWIIRDKPRKGTSKTTWQSQTSRIESAAVSTNSSKEESSGTESVFFTEESIGRSEEAAAESSELEPSADNGLIREDVKEAIDSYEDFIDEYCSFMESYDAADTTKLMQYLSLLQKEVDMSEKFDALEDDLNDAEMLYYSEVQLRCSEKLLAVSQKIGSNG